ncbi:hypothetical protein H5410_011599 [Solanum commersonii]|uniref:Uncharacterized protein n=1 Tax=Solanum commersonii TaxID=4109 RepID=A0A9J6AP34_SOLCO|nr:hypothetical protein H5410_011599 [Solanum commersonii]
MGSVYGDPLDLYGLSVKANTKIKVGNGEKTEFWKDVWHEAGRLEVSCPDQYSLDMSWAMPAKTTEAIQSWEEPGKKSKNKDKWRIVPASIWWAIWKE